MDNYLVEWYVDIYKNAYGINVDYTDILLRFDTYLKRIINGTSFEVFSNIVMVIGITLLLFHFFSDMTEKAAMKQMSMVMMGKSFAMLFASLFVIFHTKEIFIFLLRFTEGLNQSLSSVNSGSKSISDFLSNDVVLTLLNRCVTNYFGLFSVIGYTLVALPLMLVSLVTKLYVTYFAASRIIQMFVYYIFAPIGVSDIFESGPSGGINLNSSGIRYIKILFSIMLQLVVVTIIAQTFSMISSTIRTGYYKDRGDTIISEEGDLEASHGSSTTYPLRHFEYTDHHSPVREILTNSNNKVLESLSALYKLGDEEQEEKESLKEDEIYQLSDVVNSSGETIDEGKAEKILENERYRMTISSVTMFFDWCTGSDGSKMGLMILLMLTRILMIYSAPRLCNYITGVSI